MSIRKRKKKTHRQRKREREVILHLELEARTIQIIDEYRKPRRLSRQQAIKRCLKYMMLLDEDRLKELIEQATEVKDVA